MDIHINTMERNCQSCFDKKHWLLSIDFYLVVLRKILLHILFAALTIGCSFASETEDINQMIRTGQYEAALSKVDAALIQRPRNPQMMFMKGLILTEQNKVMDAIAVFTKLTENFPTLAEPYNNLAVLFAAQKQYDKAAAALNFAIRVNPSYVVAYENLGNLHMKIGIQAYQKILQLEPDNILAKSMLTMLHTFDGNKTDGLASKSGESSPAIGSVITPTGLIPAMNSKIEQSKYHDDSGPVLEHKGGGVHKDDGAHEAILQTLNGWVAAWSAQDINSYLGYYSKDFRPANGKSIKAWREERRTRLSQARGPISVQISTPQITIDNNVGRVTFHQTYVSNHFKDKNKKILVLIKQSDQWLIQQERLEKN